MAWEKGKARKAEAKPRKSRVMRLPGRTARIAPERRHMLALLRGGFGQNLTEPLAAMHAITMGSGFWGTPGSA
jgi:hypothetical protein